MRFDRQLTDSGAFYELDKTSQGTPRRAQRRQGTGSSVPGTAAPVLTEAILKLQTA